MKLNVEISQYYQHLLAFSEYEDSDRKQIVKILLAKYSTIQKLLIETLVEESKPNIIRKMNLIIEICQK